uniref:CHCH domain-containing protein n=1 Tax=Neobodo designis TaxID=312471 RepID=A0A7S1MEU3_NEODS
MAHLSSPCRDEAALWRRCLKEDDYSPDRNLKKCDGFRDTYYSCLSSWREQDGKQAPPADGFPPECSQFAARLQGCMAANQYVVEPCREEMDQLNQCTAKYDPNVQQALKYEAPKNKAWWRFW